DAWLSLSCLPHLHPQDGTALDAADDLTEPGVTAKRCESLLNRLALPGTARVIDLGQSFGVREDRRVPSHDCGSGLRRRPLPRLRLHDSVRGCRREQRSDDHHHAYGWQRTMYQRSTGTLCKASDSPMRTAQRRISFVGSAPKSV